MVKTGKKAVVAKEVVGGGDTGALIAPGYYATGWVRVRGISGDGFWTDKKAPPKRSTLSSLGLLLYHSMIKE